MSLANLYSGNHASKNLTQMHGLNNYNNVISQRSTTLIFSDPSLVLESIYTVSIHLLNYGSNRSISFMVGRLAGSSQMHLLIISFISCHSKVSSSMARRLWSGKCPVAISSRSMP